MLIKTIFTGRFLIINGATLAILALLSCGRSNGGSVQVPASSSKEKETPQAELKDDTCKKGSCPSATMFLKKTGTIADMQFITTEGQSVNWNMELTIDDSKRQGALHIIDKPAGVTVSGENTVAVSMSGQTESGVNSGSFVVVMRDITRCLALAEKESDCSVFPKSAEAEQEIWDNRETINWKLDTATQAQDQAQVLQNQQQQQQLMKTCTKRGWSSMVTVFGEKPLSDAQIYELGECVIEMVN